MPESLLSIVQQVTLHLRYAYESLKRSRSKVQDELIYSKSEAQTIAEFSAKWIKSIANPEVIIFIIMECPDLIVSAPCHLEGGGI